MIHEEKHTIPAREITRTVSVTCDLYGVEHKGATLSETQRIRG